MRTLLVFAFAVAASLTPARSSALGPEVGGNDVRISAAGGVGDASYGAFFATAATNPDAGEVLVCWEGEDDVELVNGEREIFCQRLDAATGAELGGDFRISDMGGLGSTSYVAHDPFVVYNSVHQTYLVVWWGTDDSGALVAGEREIFGQLLAGADAAEIGTDFRVSDMGVDGDLLSSAFYPAAAYNATDDELLVCWEGDDAPGGNTDVEIYCQRLDGATGAEIGANDFRVSDMGPNSNGAYDAAHPTVDYAAVEDEYLVCWSGDDDLGAVVDGEDEIYCQRLAAATGTEVGANDFRVSAMGPDGDSTFDAVRPWIAFSPERDIYLVVWYGDTDAGGLVNDELELFAQGLAAATGAALGADDFRLTDAGPDGNTFYHALSPVVVATPAGTGELLVAWHGSDNVGGVSPSEHEIYIQRLRADFLFWDGFESADISRWSSASP